MRLTGASAVVTGGASGLGKATAERLAGEGAHVVVADLVAPASAYSHPEIEFCAADVSDPEALRVAFGHAARVAPLRATVACAGIASPHLILGKDASTASESFRRILEVNCIGTFNTVRLAAELMQGNEVRNEDRGVIVTTSSAAAFDGQAGQVAYAASKGAVTAMTLPLAREFARHRIRFASISPGIFETPILAALSDNARTSILAQVPHPSRSGDPDEFAYLVSHIIENPMLNGEVIRLDGAVRLGYP